MSTADRKALRVLIFFLKYAEEGYFHQAKEPILKDVNSLIALYKSQSSIYLTDSVRVEFMDFYRGVEKYILKGEGLKTSLIMMLSLVIAVAEYFMQRVKGQKYEGWEALHACALGELSKNYAQFEEEIDKAADLADVIIESLIKN